MSKEAKVYEVMGRKLKCPICEYGKFWTRTTLMNTAGATFFGFDWANKEAQNYVCGQCSYILWFHQ